MAKKRSSFSVPATRRRASRVTFTIGPAAEDPRTDEPITFGKLRGRGDLNIDCGVCGALVADGADPAKLEAIFFECPSCETILEIDGVALENAFTAME